MKTRMRLALGMAAIGMAGASCSSSSGTKVALSGQVEFYSWWVSGGELQAMLDVYQMQNPDVDVINATGSSSAAAQAKLQMLMTEGTPPDTFQSNGGANLLQWVGINGSDANSLMEPLDSSYASEGWNFAPEMTKYLTITLTSTPFPSTSSAKMRYFTASRFSRTTTSPPRQET
jgi:ABC-type glycerol-3-phosphate transport system substrate-binding protein